MNSQTPYEVFKGRKPSVRHIRVFGCIGYAKIDAPHLRKLDDRSRSLIHRGTEPGSKPYRLLDPTSKKIVVSRDVAFDKNKAWKWIKSSEETEEPGMFKLPLNTLEGQSDSDNEGEKETEEDDDKSNEEKGDAGSPIIASA